MKLELDYKILNHNIIIYRKVNDKIDDLLKISLEQDIQIEIVKQEKKEGQKQKVAIRFHYNYKLGDRRSWFFGGFDRDSAHTYVNNISESLLIYWEKHNSFGEISSN